MGIKQLNKNKRVKPRVKPKAVSVKPKAGTSYRDKYFDLSHPGSYGGKTSFLRSLKPKERADAEAWLNTQDTYLMHKTVPRKFERTKTVAAFETQLQGDLIDVSSLAEHNSGVKFLFTVVEVFSRKAFVEPLSRKTALSVAQGFEKILKRLGFRPLYFNSDQGPEFVNGTFKALLRKHKIDFFTSNDADIKCAVVERFNRTLMGKIYRYLTKHNSYRYLDVLPDIINNYNDSPHSAVGLPPAQVTHSNKEKVWLKLYNTPTAESKKKTKKNKIGFGGPRSNPEIEKSVHKRLQGRLDRRNFQDTPHSPDRASDLRPRRPVWGKHQGRVLRTRTVEVSAARLFRSRVRVRQKGRPTFGEVEALPEKIQSVGPEQRHTRKLRDGRLYHVGERQLDRHISGQQNRVLSV